MSEPVKESDLIVNPMLHYTVAFCYKNGFIESNDFHNSRTTNRKRLDNLVDGWMLIRGGQHSLECVTVFMAKETREGYNHFCSLTFEKDGEKTKITKYLINEPK